MIVLEKLKLDISCKLSALLYISYELSAWAQLFKANDIVS